MTNYPSDMFYKFPEMCHFPITLKIAALLYQRRLRTWHDMLL